MPSEPADGRQRTLLMMGDPVLPQWPTAVTAAVNSVDWLFEPCWRGDRLMARISGGRLSLTDAGGEPADDRFDDAAAVLGTAILATDAVVDGIWTAQPFIGEGSLARAWAEALAEEGLDTAVPDPIETERRRAFVALDLVEVDGTVLHEIPFQERRRLLESVVDEGVRVRLSPIVKQPISGWVAGWRQNGFTHYVAKHMNSRYRPGEVADDWLEIPTTGERGRGFVAQMLGSRDRTRRIED